MVTIKITNFGAKMMDFSILEILDNFFGGGIKFVRQLVVFLDVGVGGEILVILGGALVRKVPAADCEFWEGDF